MATKTIDNTPKTYFDHGGGVRKTYQPANAGNQFLDSVLVPFQVGGSIPVTRVEGGTNRYMWEASDEGGQGSRPQTLTLDQSQNIFGNYCLQTVVDGGSDAGSMFTWYLTNTGFNDIDYMREFLEDPVWGGTASWQLNHYNRLRFWYRPPDELIQTVPIGNTNFHVGTYIRGVGASVQDQESDNGHFYHYFNIPPLGGGWAQMIIDPHPNTQRGTSGSTEIGVMEPGNSRFDAFNGSDTHNYFDMLTNFYITERNQNSSYPSTSYVDGVEVYHDPNTDEDIEHIYSLWAGVDLSQSPNEIVVGWKRDKDENDKTFNVKYAFDSFHANGGFAYGTNAPGGQNVDPPNLGGYNGVEYRCAMGTGAGQIDVGSNDAIYIAIQHEDETTRFREIRIPLTSSGYPQIGVQ